MSPDDPLGLAALAHFRGVCDDVATCDAHPDLPARPFTRAELEALGIEHDLRPPRAPRRRAQRR